MMRRRHQPLKRRLRRRRTRARQVLPRPVLVVESAHPSLRADPRRLVRRATASNGKMSAADLRPLPGTSRRRMDRWISRTRRQRRHCSWSTFDARHKGDRWTARARFQAWRRSNTPPAIFSTRRPARCGLGRRLQFFTIPWTEERVYGMELRCGPHPTSFLLRAPPGSAIRSQVCLHRLDLPSQVYAYFRVRVRRVVPASARRVEGPAANNPDDHHDYGRSTYNFHRDGSCLAYPRICDLCSSATHFLTFTTSRLGLAPAARHHLTGGSTAWASPTTSSPTLPARQGLRSSPPTRL